MWQQVVRFGLVLLAFAALAAPAASRVEWRIEKVLPLGAAPVDVSATADGKRVFVLLENGEVRIYSAEGELEENLGVVGSGERIDVSPTGDLLYLGSHGEKSLKIASVDTIHDFDLTGSPFQGPVDAPVEVVVYSDFQ